LESPCVRSGCRHADANNLSGAKLKALLRKTDPRNIGDLLDCFTPQECANYLANAGYASV
jgi:hypothetical protein